MTLFGTTLDGQQMLSLASMLLALVFWIFVLRRQKQSDRALKHRLMEIMPKTETKAEPKPEAKPKDEPGSNIRRGPWG